MPQLGLQQMSPFWQKLFPHGTPCGWHCATHIAPIGAQRPHSALQQYSPCPHVFFPHGMPPGSHTTFAHIAPNGAHRPQLSLQQYSPCPHVVLPHGWPPPSHVGLFDWHCPFASQYMSAETTWHPAAVGSDGSHAGLQKAPHDLPWHGSNPPVELLVVVVEPEPPPAPGVLPPLPPPPALPPMTVGAMHAPAPKESPTNVKPNEAQCKNVCRMPLHGRPAGGASRKNARRIESV
jgi:hypothetical protein